MIDLGLISVASLCGSGSAENAVLGSREPGGCPATPAADATLFQEPKARPAPRGRRLAGRAPGVTQGPALPSIRLRPAGWPGGLVWSS